MLESEDAAFWEYESSLEKFIGAHPKQTADNKAKSSQYFRILNRIEYVITLDEKYSDDRFLQFWRKFNTIYNGLIVSEETPDPIEVYFDNQLGMIEVETEDSSPRSTHQTRIAEAKAKYETRQASIMDIIEARNENEVDKAQRIAAFLAKLTAFYDHVRGSSEGQRLMVKIRSHVGEDEVVEDFGRIYRKYRIFNKKTVGEQFFRETDSMIDKLYDDFETSVRSD